MLRNSKTLPESSFLKASPSASGLEKIVQSVGVNYLLLLCSFLGFSTHPPCSFLHFESCFKLIHFSRELFVCRASKLYRFASGYLYWWKRGCVSRFMQNTAFNIDV